MKPTPPISQNIDTIGELDRIEICEERLALSASLPGDVLLESLAVCEPLDASDQTPEIEFFPQSLESESPLAPVNLLEQSKLLRSLAANDRITLDGSGQTIAVIDSGVAWDHISLGGGFGPGYRVVGGWDFAENDSNPYDDGPAGFHGTHVAGLLAGKTDSFEGVAPGADLVALRVFNDAGESQLDWIESSLRWVHENQNNFASPITTVNLSIGAALSEENMHEAMSVLEDELSLLRNDGILVFAASGNFFGNSVTDDSLMYPAASSSVVAVGSVNELGQLSSFSQRSDGLLATDGEAVRSAVPEHVYGWDGRVDDFSTLSGTSMATPQVAAASVLVRQAMIDEGLIPTADDVLDRLRYSTSLQTDPLTGAVFNTIDLLTATAPPTVDPANSTELPTDNNPPIQITNEFIGTSANDHYILDLRDGISLRLGESVYQFVSTSDSSPIIIDVGSGADSFQIIGSDTAERLILRPVASNAPSTLSTNQFSLQIRGAESIVFDGGGGSDQVTLYDDAGDDVFRSTSSESELTGSGFQFQVKNVPTVFVFATAGGDDQAFLTDSIGDDTLAVRPQFTSLRSESDFRAAYGFERVYVYASSGGNDMATLYDSVGDDLMSVSSRESFISGPGYQVTTRGFDSVEAFAINGGNDLVNIYADDANSRWDRSDDRLQWIGQDGSLRIARGFERMQAFEEYQAIDLTIKTQAMGNWGFDTEEFNRRQREAAQAVFDWLGNEST